MSTHLVIIEAVRAPLVLDQAGGLADGTRVGELLSPIVDAILTRSRTRPEQIDEIVVCGTARNTVEALASKAVDLQSASGTTALEERARVGSAPLTLVAAVRGRESPFPASTPPVAPMGVESVSSTVARSVARAVAADAAGDFVGEIAPVVLAGTNGWVLERDEVGAFDRDRLSVRVGAGSGGSAALLETDRPPSALAPPAFGAAALLVCAEDRAVELGFRPLARILASVGERSTTDTVWEVQERVTSRALARAGLLTSQLDHVEIDERFSQAPEVWGRRFRVHEDLVNPRGGALALGVPGLASGLRLVVTVINGLRTSGGVFGLVIAHELDDTVRAIVVERTDQVSAT
ncbi:hypothetical protein [Pseudonocardia xishanensis]|uniref:Thiolase C-terminal domain-containing protein n=1 Tax=Pseudonocardia xishanensis TaxID=630995 RepID=A0ABP8RYP8_9PSEU